MNWLGTFNLYLGIGLVMAELRMHGDPKAKHLSGLSQLSAYVYCLILWPFIALAIVTMIIRGRP